MRPVPASRSRSSRCSPVPQRYSSSRSSQRVSSRAFPLLLAVFALVSGWTSSSARADADPASDVLYAQSVFYSFDRLPTEAAQKRLNEVVAASGKAGYPIRVALIGDASDLGGVTALWKKPRTYAHFLGLELSFAYHDSLLVVMPVGIGYYKQGVDPAAGYASLRGVRVQEGIDGLADTAVQAVSRLATAAGHPIAVPPKGDSGGGSSGRNRLIILLAGLMVVTLGAAMYVLRRREPAVTARDDER
jgi:hypothetical protein